MGSVGICALFFWSDITAQHCGQDSCFLQNLIPTQQNRERQHCGLSWSTQTDRKVLPKRAKVRETVSKLFHDLYSLMFVQQGVRRGRSIATCSLWCHPFFHSTLPLFTMLWTALKQPGERKWLHELSHEENPPQGKRWWMRNDPKKRQAFEFGFNPSFLHPITLLVYKCTPCYYDVDIWCVILVIS